MNKGAYNVLIGIGAVIFLLGFFLTSLGGYAAWRSFESIGIYSFTSTGEVWRKEGRERTGRRSSKVVYYDYGAFVSEDGKYRAEERVSPSLKSGIQRGNKYTVKREVFVDRLGDYKVTAPESKEKHDKRIWTNVMVFAFITLLGGTMAFLGLRAKRRRFA